MEAGVIPDLVALVDRTCSASSDLAAITYVVVTSAVMHLSAREDALPQPALAACLRLLNIQDAPQQAAESLSACMWCLSRHETNRCAQHRCVAPAGKNSRLKLAWTVTQRAEAHVIAVKHHIKYSQLLTARMQGCNAQGGQLGVIVGLLASCRIACAGPTALIDDSQSAVVPSWHCSI
jgi:hypothetical protein